jgi:trehalose 6-phosphate synthase/phosphatase
MSNKIIIVSNRLPFKLEKRAGRVELRKSTGGLVSAVESSIQKDDNIVWVGAADFSQELWEECRDQMPEGNYSVHPIFLERKIEKLYYNGFSNTVIWPLFHYFPTYAEYKEEFYDAYRQVNEIFARETARITEEGDMLWVHDYHLMLMPGLVREAKPFVPIGFFLHIPFPSYELLKLLPEKWRTDIFSSLLACDVVGFHIKEYVSHFVRSISYFAGVETSNHLAYFNNRIVLVKDYPISIDFKKFSDAYSTRAVSNGRKQLRNRYKNLKIIFSVDRLDYTKGVINRLDAYEELLEDHEELREKVIFIINVIPSRDKLSMYAEKRRMIEEQVSHINGLFGSVNWQPVMYQYSHLTFNQLVSFYTGCDVALVTPLRDGMNLVAKEFAASRQDKKGALILSEFAGAAVELHGALLVNPNDINLMKNVMIEALNMSEEAQQKAMEQMQQAIQAYDIGRWTNEFIHDLQEERKIQHEGAVRIMTYDERMALFEAYRNASSRLIVLDYDGTLSPFFDDPQAAVPSSRTREILLELSANPRNKVILISGRDRRTLENWFTDIPIDLVAEHGGFYKAVNGTWSEPETESDSWKPLVKEIMDVFVKAHPGTFIEEKEHSVVWHYRTAQDFNEEETVAHLSRELTICNTTNKFSVLHGNKIIEARNSLFDKGSFVAGFVGSGNFDFVLAMGDDNTDEAMFAKLNGAGMFTIKVGLQHTAAMYNVVGVSNVFSFLEQLLTFNSVLLKAE